MQSPASSSGISHGHLHGRNRQVMLHSWFAYECRARCLAQTPGRNRSPASSSGHLWGQHSGNGQVMQRPWYTCNAEPSACICITAGVDTCVEGTGRGLWPCGKTASATPTVSATALPPETPTEHACSTSQDCLCTPTMAAWQNSKRHPNHNHAHIATGTLTAHAYSTTWDHLHTH